MLGYSLPGQATALRSRLKSPLIRGGLVGLFVVAGLELLALNGGRMESPPPILAIPVILAAYWGGIRGGLLCAGMIFAYIALGWKAPGAGLAYSDDMLIRLGTLAFGLPFAAVFVGYLKQKSDARFEDLRVSESAMRVLHDQMDVVLQSRDRILDQSMDMICTANAAGQFTMVSAASERILGYHPSELVGRRFMDFVHPDDHERTTLVATKIISGLHTVDFINRFIRKDGTVLHLMWSSRWCVEDQLMYAVARDYTEQRQVDEERARYVAIIEATSDLVGMSWSDGRVSYINGAGRRMLGIGPDDDVTRIRVTDIYAEWAAELLTGHATRTATDSGIWTGETALQPRTGAAIPVSQIILSHRNPDGSIEFMSTIARDITTIKALEARLQLEAATDELTGLFNRRHFMERLRASLHSARRRGHLLSFALCDLDGFKQINDRHGHPVGDLVLQSVGKILSEEIRGEDIVGRYGGDEFCMVFPHVSAKEASICLERIRRRVGALKFLEGDSAFSITMTFGVVDRDESHVSEDLLIEEADRALYRAKASGRDRVGLGL
jgi:diguanylate cyclase (GGDEF)-like protein/PAS domain S-box-containing protein